MFHDIAVLSALNPDRGGLMGGFQWPPFSNGSSAFGLKSLHPVGAPSLARTDACVSPYATVNHLTNNHKSLGPNFVLVTTGRRARIN